MKETHKVGFPLICTMLDSLSNNEDRKVKENFSFATFGPIMIHENIIVYDIIITRIIITIVNARRFPFPFFSLSEETVRESTSDHQIQ